MCSIPLVAVCAVPHVRHLRACSTVSAPGKVLITGGYLVLRSLPGLTLSTTARFRTSASWRKAPASGAGAGAGAGAFTRAGEAAKRVGVVVTSPQLWCEWRYTMDVAHPFKLTSTCVLGAHACDLSRVHLDARSRCARRWLLRRLSHRDGKRNKFVERAVECAMQVFGKVVPDGELGRVLQAQARRGLEIHLHLVADNDFYSQRGHVRVWL